MIINTRGQRNNGTSAAGPSQGDSQETGIACLARRTGVAAFYFRSVGAGPDYTSQTGPQASSPSKNHADRLLDALTRFINRTHHHYYQLEIARRSVFSSWPSQIMSCQPGAFFFSSLRKKENCRHRSKTILSVAGFSLLLLTLPSSGRISNVYLVQNTSFQPPQRRDD